MESVAHMKETHSTMPSRMQRNLGRLLHEETSKNHKSAHTQIHPMIPQIPSNLYKSPKPNYTDLFLYLHYIQPHVWCRGPRLKAHWYMHQTSHNDNISQSPANAENRRQFERCHWCDKIAHTIQRFQLAVQHNTAIMFKKICKNIHALEKSIYWPKMVRLGLCKLH